MSDILKSGGWDCHVHVFDTAHPLSHGHYQPDDWTLAQLAPLAQPWGIAHFVLVQPSVYGSDNRVMLSALRAAHGRHRGVAVVDDNTSLEQLLEMDQLGVRGIRFNLVSPIGNDTALLSKVVPWLRMLGWHIEWYAHAHHLPDIVRAHRVTGLPCVLDHMGTMSVDKMFDMATWDALRQLAKMGAWVKLSGWYRLNDRTKDFSASRPNIHSMLDLFKERAIWGSDSPHTFFERSAVPSYQSLIDAVEGFADHDVQAILRNAQQLYH